MNPHPDCPCRKIGITKMEHCLGEFAADCKGSEEDAVLKERVGRVFEWSYWAAGLFGGILLITLILGSIFNL